MTPKTPTTKAPPTTKTRPGTYRGIAVEEVYAEPGDTQPRPDRRAARDPGAKAQRRAPRGRPDRAMSPPPPPAAP